MKITLERVIPINEALFAKLRAAPLDAAGEEPVLIYENAIIRLGDFFPDELNPLSLYVVRKNLDMQRRLYETMLAQYGINIFQLSDILHFRTEDGELRVLHPPFVEFYQEQVKIGTRPGDRESPENLWLKILFLKDGTHRAYTAREMRQMLRCIVVHGALRTHPPYAYPNCWSQVVMYDEVPPQHLKKFYRRENPYSFMRPLHVLRQTGEESAPELGWNRQK